MDVACSTYEVQKGCKQQCFPNFFARRHLLASKKIADLHILGHVNMDCPADWYPKLKTYNIPELILASYQYIPVAYVTMHCII